MAIRNQAIFLPCLAFCLIFYFAESTSSNSNIPKPETLRSLIPQNATKTQKVGSSCSYTVSIKTSCSSTKYTRDKISIAFGDACGNKIYAAKIDDPASKTFERCSTDTFEISGACSKQICYLYLYRTGRDGWKPETVKVYGRTTKSITFYFDSFIPSSTWYGFDLCSGQNSTM